MDEAVMGAARRGAGVAFSGKYVLPKLTAEDY
jgi:hypothetical protein